MNRRVFLGVVSGLLTPRLLQASTQPIPLRRLRLADAHTGETFDGPFRDDTGPVQQALAELSEFLRDHHSGERIVFDIGVLDFLASIMEAVGANEALVLSGYRTPPDKCDARTNDIWCSRTQTAYVRRRAGSVADNPRWR